MMRQQERRLQLNVKVGCLKVIFRFLEEKLDNHFGLKAVLVMAMYEVEGSDFDGIAARMQEIPEVQSAEVARMDLALG